MNENTEKPLGPQDIVFCGGGFEKEKLAVVLREMAEKEPYSLKRLFKDPNAVMKFEPIPNHIRQKIKTRWELLRPSDPEVFVEEMAREPQPLTQVLKHYGFESDGTKPMYHREDGACVIVHASSIEEMDKIHIARLLMMPNSSVEISTDGRPLTIKTLLVEGHLSINTDKPFACHYLESSGMTAITDFSNAEGSDPDTLRIYLGHARDLRIINPFVFEENGKHHIKPLDDNRCDILPPSQQNRHPEF